MQCEMCGETIRGPAKLVRVEGAEFRSARSARNSALKCSRYGARNLIVRVKQRPVREKPPRFGSTAKT